MASWLIDPSDMTTLSSSFPTGEIGDAYSTTDAEAGLTSYNVFDL